ncbi:F-box domain-containing protein [Mycena chlorophos]|uniref:F-box domain-containing protein n=1 Tax=Mycena chlorophos TaxID=658473 RepID=A0A8H6SA30_MYCCL|nr:F-box domain-containing protein [Mycena chlorophos]
MAAPDLAELLSGARQHLARLDDVPRPQATETISIRRRAKAIDLIASLALVIAPIHQLPSEVLALIFIEIVQPDAWKTADEWHLDTSSFRSALRLSQVCSAWRKVALSNPRLWCVVLPIDGAPDTLDSALIARRFFNLSEPFPLPLFCPSKCPPDMRHEILVASSRASSFDVCSIDLLKDTLGDGCPVLESLQSLHVNVSPKCWRQETAAFLTAENLATVELHNAFFPLPWHRLTKLTLCFPNVDPDDCLDALFQCSGLIDLTLVMQLWEDEPNSKFPSRTLAALESLQLEFVDGELEGISFEGADDWSNHTQTAFTDFLLGAAQLERLCLRSCPLDGGDVQAMLVCAPKLQELEMHRCFALFADALIGNLIYEPADPTAPLAPLLHSIVVNHFVGEEVDEEILGAMIASRAPPGKGKFAVAPWRKIHLCYEESGYSDSDPISPTLRAKIAVLKKRGLDVSIQSLK